MKFDFLLHKKHLDVCLEWSKGKKYNCNWVDKFEDAYFTGRYGSLKEWYRILFRSEIYKNAK